MSMIVLLVVINLQFPQGMVCLDGRVFLPDANFQWIYRNLTSHPDASTPTCYVDQTT